MCTFFLFILYISLIVVAEGWSNQSPKTFQASWTTKSSLKAVNNNEEDLLFPQPLVWQWSPSSSEEDWISTVVGDEDTTWAALKTWNWSRKFVFTYNLCPWAKGSLETQNAIQIFLVPNEEQDSANRYGGNCANAICKQVAEKCLAFCQENPTLQSAAIFMVVFPEKEHDDDDDGWESFIDFYEWFTDLEERNWEMEDIIIAPFHPNWQFDGADTNSLDFEKKSPFPTVTFVSAMAVERAGEIVTEQISKHNEQVLMEKSPEDWKAIWDQSSRI